MVLVAPDLQVDSVGQYELGFAALVTDETTAYMEGRYKVTGSANWINLADMSAVFGELDPVFQIGGLQPETAYSFESRAKNFAGTDFSAWAALANTTNPPVAVSASAETIILDRNLSMRHRAING